MITLGSVTWRAAVVGRWTARIAGTLLALFFLVFFFGEGPPNPLRLTTQENLQFLAMGSLCLGLIVAWKWEGLGGLLSVAGFALMALINRSHLHMWAFQWPTVVGLVGLLHVLCWWRFRAGPPAARVGWEAPRKVLVVVGLAVAVFVLFCANEMFGMPPLMTPAFRPPPGMVGAWQARLTTVEVDFTINADASVSGGIGDALLVNGRMIYNRSWFGRFMNWRTDYLILGKLSQVVESYGGIAGDRFTAPLSFDGPELKGALFLSEPGRPMPLGLRLRKQQVRP